MQSFLFCDTSVQALKSGHLESNPDSADSPGNSRRICLTWTPTHPLCRFEGDVISTVRRSIGAGNTKHFYIVVTRR